MGFKMPAIVAVVALVCAGVGLLFQIVGVATTGWVTGGDGVFEIEIGLWTTCIAGNCADTSPAQDWLEACRAFGILGLLLLAAVVAVGVLMCFMDNDKFPLIAAILAFVAGFCILIEFAVFAGEFSVAGANYGYSFALTIVACVLAVVAGVCFFVAKGKTAA